MSSIEVVRVAKKIDLLSAEQKEGNGFLIGGELLWWPQPNGQKTPIFGKEFSELMFLAPMLTGTMRLGGISSTIKLHGLQLYQTSLSRDSSKNKTITDNSELAWENTVYITALKLDQDLIARLKPFVGGGVVAVKNKNTTSDVDFYVNYYITLGFTILSNYFPRLEFNVGIRKLLSNHNKYSQGSELQYFVEIKRRI